MWVNGRGYGPFVRCAAEAIWWCTLPIPSRHRWRPAFRWRKAKATGGSYIAAASAGTTGNSFAPDQSRLYAGEYVSTLYQDRDGIKLAFDKIKALPAEKSDNVGRVRFVDTYCRSRWSGGQERAWRLLDVGAGLGVFPFGMKQAGLGLRCARHG